ncbi:MAG: glycosyltransferase [Verrucomicrobiales bacterium]|nr:glycosyltransferase [Verrucomicrobiales bacterium]
MWHHIKEFPIYSSVFQELGSWLHLTKALLTLSIPNRLESLTRAYSLAQSQFTIRLISHVLSRYLPSASNSIPTKITPLWERHQIGWKRYQTQLDQSAAASRTLILKAPNANGEKGVIVSCFEYNWLRILSGTQPFEKFDHRYTLIFSTSWSPTNYNILALALEKISGPVFVIPCNYKESEKLNQFHPRIHPLSCLACDWLNPDFFDPKPWVNREIDILMVSNWAPFKRHWHFFDILQKLPADLKVVCVGQPEGSFTLEHIKELQKTHNAPQHIEYLERIPIEKVNELQCNSKIAIILSRREGCCVAAVEGMMAGAYLAMLEDAHIGPLDYINAQTGIKLKPETATQQISDLLNRPPEISPHEWAKANISCHNSIDKVNNDLKVAALHSGQPWTKDLATPCWRPFPCFIDPADKQNLVPFAEKLTKSFPSVFPAKWVESSRF